MKPQTIRPDLAPDQKESLVIARRRQVEEERKARIFNAKERVFGVDTAALDEQIALKKAQQELEKQRSTVYDQLTTTVGRTLTTLESEQERQRADLKKELDEFRATQQRKDQRREWDLNDPMSLKRDIPARTSDVDPRLGPASLQKFEGEDLGAKERSKMQATQLRSWLSQQATEKSLRVQGERDLESAIAARDTEIKMRAAEMEEAQQRARADMTRATAELNLSMAMSRKEMEAQRRLEEEQDALEEVRNQLDSDLLTENRATTQHSFSAHRVVPYHFKGLSADSRQAILDEQARQRAHLEEERERQRREQQQWETQQQQAHRELLLREREVERERRRIAEQVAEEQRTQAAAQRERERYLNREVYSNEVRPEYFDQFNTSSR